MELDPAGLGHARHPRGTAGPAPGPHRAAAALAGPGAQPAPGLSLGRRAAAAGARPGHQCRPPHRRADARRALRRPADRPPRPGGGHGPLAPAHRGGTAAAGVPGALEHQLPPAGHHLRRPVGACWRRDRQPHRGDRAAPCGVRRPGGRCGRRAPSHRFGRPGRWGASQERGETQGQTLGAAGDPG